MDTLGSLVDKLSIVNCKLFAVQDWVHHAQSQEPDAFGAVSHEHIQSKLRDLTSLNQQRNKLMTEIDHVLELAARTGIVSVEDRIKVGIPEP